MSSSLTSQTILVVDDEDNLRQTLGLILQHAGYSVTTAGSVAVARQYLLAGGFDLIFLDLKMPEEDGLSLLPEIRHAYPETPVLILTAHATLESAIEAVRQGARDYLLKPIDPPQIISRIQEVLSESKQPRRRREIVGEIKTLLSELDSIEDPSTAEDAENNQAVSASSSRYLQRGPFNLDLHARHVTMRNRSIALSPTAFDYLVTLLRHSPDPVTYETLVMESQGYKTSLIEARDLARWRIHELRKAIEPDPRQPQNIITIRSIGYRLVI